MNVLPAFVSGYAVTGPALQAWRLKEPSGTWNATDGRMTDGNCAWDGNDNAAAGAGSIAAIDAAVMPTPDFDGVWKEAIETWLPDCLRLFLPQVYDSIDWDVAPVFLDREMRRLDRILKRGTQHLDKLVQVRLKTGNRALLLIHLEIQAGDVDAVFPTRMFAYYIRLWERHPGQPILPCAVLLDCESESETQRYCCDVLGSRLELTFPVIALGAWRDRMAELQALASTNPFAVLVLAHLECRATRPDMGRLASKKDLVRALQGWGYTLDQRVRLFRLIDSLLVLPLALEDRFYDDLDEAEVKMKQLSSIERVYIRREKQASWKDGEQTGLQKGQQNTLRDLVAAKFGDLPDWAQTHIAGADAALLRRWSINVLSADRIETVFDR